MKRDSSRRYVSAQPALMGVLIALALSFFPLRGSSEVVDRIVAIINDSVITLSELNAASSLLAEKEGPGARKDEAFRSRVLDSLIEQKIVKQASDRAGIDISEKEIDNAVEEIKRQNSLSQENLLVLLAQSGLTLKEYREQMREQIRQVKFMNKEFHSKISIQDEEIEEYYRHNRREFFGAPSYRIRMLYISGADRGLLKKRLSAVEEGLKNGEDFSALAREFSDGGSASSGGDLGFIKTGEIDKAMEEAVQRLKPGEITPPMERPDGMYFIQLVDIRAGEERALEDVKGVIRDRLFKKALDGRFDFWLKEVKKTAHVEIRF